MKCIPYQHLLTNNHTFSPVLADFYVAETARLAALAPFESRLLDGSSMAGR